MAVQEHKSALRKACRERVRAKAGSEASRRAGERAQEHFLKAYPPRPGMAVAVYRSVRGEVGTERIREACLAAGASVYYPCVVSRGTLEFYPHRDGDGWVEGPYGIPEPARPPGSLPRKEGFDLVLVPGVAFDRHGRRLGQGMGYYDRFLKEIAGTATIVGLAYSEQVVEEVPVDGQDVPVDALVTEEGVTRCHRGPGAPKK